VPFSVPKPHQVLDLTMSDGAKIYVRRHGNPDGPRLILSHGNGFAIDAYFPFWRHLIEDCDVIVYDQRNHGWNPLHRAAGHTQAQMAEDLETILSAVPAAFGARATAGAFHSLSSTVSLLHYLKHGWRWDALILFDPPLAPPAGHRLHLIARNFDLAMHDWARQRPRRFADPDELAAHFKRSRRLRRWVAGAAELMARAITRPTGDGGCALVCPPEFEADIYVQNANAPAWPALPALAGRLFIVSSDPAAPGADPPGKVCAAVRGEFGIDVVTVPDSGHLLQIEHPQQVAAIVREHLRARGLAPGAAARH
jgi:pimeloyl-ACP methyl ester carboxylesterase